MTPRKSEHYLVVMELMLFENVVLSELCSERVTFKQQLLFLGLENARVKVMTCLEQNLSS